LCSDVYTDFDNNRCGGRGPDREIAMLGNAMLGKSCSSKFNVATFEKQTDAFIETVNE